MIKAIVLATQQPYLWIRGIRRKLNIRLTSAIQKIGGLLSTNDKSSKYIQRVLLFALYGLHTTLNLSVYCVALAIYLLPAAILSMTLLQPLVALYSMNFLMVIAYATEYKNLELAFHYIWWAMVEGRVLIITHYINHTIILSRIAHYLYNEALTQQEQQHAHEQPSQAETATRNPVIYYAKLLLLTIPNFIISIPFRAVNALDQAVEYMLRSKAASLRKKNFDIVSGSYRKITSGLYFMLMQPLFITASLFLTQAAYLVTPAIGILPALVGIHVVGSIWLGLTACSVAALNFYNEIRSKSHQDIQANNDPDTITIQTALINNNYKAILELYKNRPAPTEIDALSDFWTVALEGKISSQSTFLDGISEAEKNKLEADDDIPKCNIVLEIPEHPVYRVSSNGVRKYYDLIHLLRWLQQSKQDPGSSEAIISFDEIHYDSNKKKEIDAKVAAARTASQATELSPAPVLHQFHGNQQQHNNRGSEYNYVQHRRCVIC